MSRQLPLGETEAGREWCLKALHPADPLMPTSGIPDEDSYPVVLQAYNQNVTILNPLPTNPGNWDADVFFFPHPYIFGAVKTVDATGAVAWSCILNTQINGADVDAKRSTFVTLCERYRLSYLGITGYHDAAAVSNNGLLACAQYPDTPGYLNVVSSGLTGSAANYACRAVETWIDPPRTFTQLQQALNPYLGAAREGVYAPFRLSETSQDWQNATDLVVHGNQGWGALMDGYPWHALPATVTADYPYGLSGPTTTQWGSLINRRSDTGIIHVSLKQLASDASFTFYVRAGWEFQVLPGSTLASFSKTSPLFDPVALTSYFRISRELKDAYPASYNDLGEILGTIAEAAKDVVGTIFPAARIPLNLVSAFLNRKTAAPAAASQALGSTLPTPDLVSAATKERVQSASSGRQRAMAKKMARSRR